MISTHSQTLPAGGSMRIMGARSLVIKKPAFPISLKVYGPQSTLLGSGVDIDKRFTFFAGFDALPMSFEISTDSAQAIEAYSSSGQINIDDIDVANITAPVERSMVAESLPDVSCAATATTLIYGGDAAAIEVMIENLSGEVLRLGDINTTAGRGKPLNPYSEAVIKTGAALYVYNPGAAAIDVAVTVLKV